MSEHSDIELLNAIAAVLAEHEIDFSDSAVVRVVTDPKNSHRQWFEYRCDCKQWFPGTEEHREHVAKKIRRVLNRHFLIVSR